MNLGVGDYYSLVGNRYVKQANVQVIGVDSNQPYCEQKQQKIVQSHIYNSQKNISNESVIKEEEIQYDLQQPFESAQNSNKKRRFNSSKLREKSEVNSLYVKDESNEGDYYPTYSLIANSTHKNRANIKQKLQEMQTVNLKSEQREDSCSDEKYLYLQLEKQKKKRMDLEKEYKKLLQIQYSENYLQFEETDKEAGSLTKRQYSKRTFKEPKDQKPLFSCRSAKLRKASTKLRDRTDSTELYPAQQISQTNQSQNQNHKIPKFQAKSQDNKQFNKQEQLISHYSSEHAFQQNLIQQLRFMYEKIEKIDHFLGQRQKTIQNEALKRQIALKDKQIVRLRQLKITELKSAQGYKLNQESSLSNNSSVKSYDLSFINQMQPTTLYAGCLLIMVLIVILA